METRAGNETTRVEDERVEEFLQAIIEVCRKYGLSLSHEDAHGGFIVENYRKENIEWLLAAAIGEDDEMARGS